MASWRREHEGFALGREWAAHHVAVSVEAIGFRASGNGEAVDRLVLMVRDPFWLHVHWELTGEGVERAKASLGHLWHTAKPMLRLLRRPFLTAATRSFA